jgi:hypothetical protein
VVGWMHFGITYNWKVDVSWKLHIESNIKDIVDNWEAESESMNVLIQDIDSIESPLAANIISGITIPKKKELHLMFQTAHADAIDLMKKLFLFNPN